MTKHLALEIGTAALGLAAIFSPLAATVANAAPDTAASSVAQINTLPQMGAGAIKANGQQAANGSHIQSVDFQQGGGAWIKYVFAPYNETVSGNGDYYYRIYAGPMPDDWNSNAYPPFIGSTDPTDVVGPVTPQEMSNVLASLGVQPSGYQANKTTNPNTVSTATFNVKGSGKVQLANVAAPARPGVVSI